MARKLSSEERAEAKKIIIEYLKKFPFIKWASKFAGVTHKTFYAWVKEDPVFAIEAEKARAEGVLYWGGRATPDLVLKSADPETFRERKEIEVKTPVPLLVNVVSSEVLEEKKEEEEDKT